MVLTLIEYLQNSKQAIENLTLDNEITLVIGNEACDLDSAVSAIAYGYLLSIINSNNEILLPILNIKQEDYCLRTEINYVFNKADIPSYNLIFRDDLNLKELHYKGHVNIILVDHNSFKSHEKYLNSNIQEIIDHHEVLEKIDDRVNVTIEKVGSCATLVAEKFFGANLKQYDIKLALLLYATILTDTINLSPTAKKATNKDIKYLQALESQLPEMDRDDFFNSIQSAKFDVTGMTVKQILRKDIKTIESSSLCIAISSISIPIPELMRRNEAMSEIEKFCDTNNYQALVIMSLVTKEEIEREISIYSSFDSYREQIEDVLESTKNPSLELEVMEHRIPKMTAFHQKNASVSRKVVLPLLHKFLLGADSPLSPMNDTVMNQSFSKIDFNGISAISSTSSKNSNDTSPMSYFSTPSDRGKTPMTPKNSYADDNYIDNIQYARQIMSLTGNLVEKVLQKKNLMEDDDDIISSSSNAEDEQLSSDEKQEKTDDRIIDVTTQNNNETVNEHNSTKRLEEEEKQDSGKSVNGSIGYGEVESVEASAYTAQTVDFPDSPHQLKLLQKKSFDTQILRLDDEYDEEELRAALSPSSNNSEQCKALKKRIMPDQMPSFLSSSDDDDDEYFEDDLIGGSYHTTDTSSCETLTDEDEPSSEQLEMKALEQMASEKKNRSNTAKNFIIKHPPQNHVFKIHDSDDNNNKNKVLSDSFLFDEKASNDGIDKGTIQKVKVCFDQNRIKDLYMLSGRLQDMISPEEIEEILDNIDIYSEFIDDNILESLTSKGLHVSNEGAKSSKKTICAENITHENDECHIRAVFEKQCQSSIPNPKNMCANIPQNEDSNSAQDIFANSSDIRAFFEESLVKSASTLKIIHAKMDDADESLLHLSVSSPNLNEISDDDSGHCSNNDSEILKDRPSSLDPLTQPMKRKILVTPDILRSKDDDQKSLSSLSNHSETEMFSRSVDDLMTPDDIDTPDDLDESILERFGSMDSETIPEMSAAEEYDEERSWRTCFIAGIERRIDMKVIEPYKKVLSHGGYYGENKNAIILFSACYLPDRSRRDYDYVMDNLFLYVLTTLDALVAEDYILIYLHGATQRSNMPSFGWLKRCYQMIDRRLRKNLKQLFLVHPSFWVKTIVIMTKPFISSKFSRKLKFITNLQELGEIIPLDNVCIPDKVKQLEFELMIQERKRQLSRSKSTPHQRNLGLG